MTFIGRLHPLLIHFPIALVIVAVTAEAMAVLTGHGRWHALAVGNIQAAAAFAIVAVVAGWRLALVTDLGASALLEWHRWLGTVGGAMTVTAALATARAEGRSAGGLWMYRAALFGAAAAVAAAGHLGGLLVWGVDFLRP
jgi:uncharacterized membrane protein